MTNCAVVCCIQGPLAIFNARNNWSAPRAVELHRGHDGYGFTVRGDSPVIIASVDKGYIADVSFTKFARLLFTNPLLLCPQCLTVV